MMRSTGCTKILIASFAVWFIVLFFVARHLSMIRSSGQVQDMNKYEVTASKLKNAVSSLEQLQQKSYDIEMIVKEMDEGNLREGKLDTMVRLLNKINELEQDTQTQRTFLEMEDNYETVRRRVENGFQEFWYFVSNQIPKIRALSGHVPEAAEKLERFMEIALEHKLSLFKDLNLMKQIDGYQSWRETEAANLMKEVENRLNYLQNPSDCSKAKKLLCNLNKGCGLGCQIHHAAYCLIVAYATKRTLILTSRGWRYHRDGWEDIFLPVSNTCVTTPGQSIMNWPGKPEAQTLILPIIDNIHPKPDFLPPAIPEDLGPRLVKLHSQPLAWWIGQMLKYLLRPQPTVANFLEIAKEKLLFKKPVVGVHIRRTDKIGTEAAYHPIEEYMKKVDDWYDQMENNGVEITIRRIFLATDDPKVIIEAREKYPEYEVLGDPETAKSAAMSTRYTDDSLYGILLDLHLLSLSDHIVCTFSSQVCRAAYELMQTHSPDAGTHFTSLDDVYYYGGQNAYPSVAVISNKNNLKALEMDMKVGDEIAVAGNHWDGFSKGKNLRTNIIGLYPSFKVRNRVKFAKFPTYEEMPRKNPV